MSSGNGMSGGSLCSYITKNGDLYSWGAAPIGDGSNIPRKNPILVLQNVIQSCWIRDRRCALTSAGEFYTIDVCV